MSRPLDRLGRDARGRFLPRGEVLRRLELYQPPKPDRSWRPPAATILANPTDRWPRWRLRVFDLCWPWRASAGEALQDAKVSGNARWDPGDRITYLDTCANIQRDPPLGRRRRG